MHVTAKGGLAGASAAGVPAELAVGTAGQILTADPNATAGFNWETDPWLLLGPSGVLAETFPRGSGATIGNASILTSGTLYVRAIPLKSGIVVTSATWVSATTALSGGANRWGCILDSSRAVIRQETDQLATAWGANTAMLMTLDSVPTTAGARVASTTVTLTIPTLNQALSALFTAGDSIVVSNANIAAYNGTFTVNAVTSTTITYTAGSSATDSLVAPFPTVQMASGKRTYTVPTTGLYYLGLMVGGTVPTLEGTASTKSNALGLATIIQGNSSTTLTGTCPSPAGAITVGVGAAYAYIK